MDREKGTVGKVHEQTLTSRLVTLESVSPSSEELDPEGQTRLPLPRPLERDTDLTSER
jgi:hypothetical protein